MKPPNVKEEEKWGDLLRGGLAAVGGLAHFTCNFSILGDLLRGGACCAFLRGGLAAPPQWGLTYVFSHWFESL